jgi:hypothetical protein
MKDTHTYCRVDTDIFALYYIEDIEEEEDTDDKKHRLQFNSPMLKCILLKG